ncbi:hypothetical protein ACQKEU_28155, partial [Acidovorax sp. NPDC077664]|uniref:hypothetical protein n=1 Tax=Acidovorax sp. NPDC077664 TaxID=3390544 RepID=UPI003D0312E6
GRPFFGDFLSATRKKVTAPPGAHPGSRPQHRHTSQTSELASSAQVSTSSTRRDGVADGQGFDRLNPNGRGSMRPGFDKQAQSDRTVMTDKKGFHRLSPNGR